MSDVVTLLRVAITLLGPWAVGGLTDGSDEIDLPILKDPRGAGTTPYLPTTSLVGALREHLGDQGARWLGPLPGPLEKRTGEVRHIPSPIWALGTRLEGDHVASNSGSTRIDGQRRAAAAGSLRCSERVETQRSGQDGRASQVLWYLQIDEPVPDDMVQDIANWRPFIGRGRGVGLGRAEVSEVVAVQVRLSERDHLTWWLTERQQWLDGSSESLPATPCIKSPDGLAGDRTTIPGLDWEVVEPLAVGTGESATNTGPGEGSARRAAAREVRRVLDWPVIPGTAWRGIFRHRVEFILKAIGAAETPDPVSHSVVNYLFGPAPEDNDELGGRRGVLRFLDSRITDQSGDKPDLCTRHHVAIDRITGGAAPGLLFAVEAVEPGARMTTVIETDDPLPAALGRLLLWVVHDLDSGMIGLGGSTTRGYGTVRLVSRTLLEGLAPVGVADLRQEMSELKTTRLEGAKR
jgi:CRISPR/Cas system CSM-associated protein Csm3 (group 7 of RAMP superfamily)